MAIQAQLKVAAAFAAIILAVGGCSTQEADAPQSPPPTASGVNAVLQYSNVWIPNALLDLMSPEATFVRAATESIDRSGYGEGEGVEAIENAAYPGFARAFNNVIDPEVIGGNARKDQAKVGTLYYEVAQFQPSELGFTVGVCTYGSATATKVWNGYISSGRAAPATSALVFSFGPDPALADNDQIAPAAHQAGPANAPSTNVFGTWIMTSIKILGANVELPQCANKLAPSTPKDIPEDSYVATTPPPAAPPAPGWPEASSN